MVTKLFFLESPLPYVIDTRFFTVRHVKFLLRAVHELLVRGCIREVLVILIFAIPCMLLSSRQRKTSS